MSSELPGSMVWCLSLILENPQPLFIKYFFCSFLSFHSSISGMHILQLLKCPQFLDILYWFLFFSSVGISSWEISKDISLSSLIFFPGHVQSPNEPSKTFFIFVTVFLTFNTHFNSILGFLSLYLYYPSILACCLLFLLESLTYYSYHSKILSVGSKICALICFWFLLCFFILWVL